MTGFSLTPLLSPPFLPRTENVSAPLNLVQCEECEDNIPHTDKVTQSNRSCFSGLSKRKTHVSPIVNSGVLTMKKVESNIHAVYC